MNISAYLKAKWKEEVVRTDLLYVNKLLKLTH